ncbi:hypothetical protein BsWGS_11001 [Bradybaena similaris]
MDSTESHPDTQPGAFKRFMAIPCMKTSFVSGISSGLGIGLTYFLFTSNVLKSYKWGIGGYAVFLYGTWVVCRYQNAVKRHNALQWQKLQEKHGGQITHVDPKDV